jgi:hypothetical protein
VVSYPLVRLFHVETFDLLDAIDRPHCRVETCEDSQFLNQQSVLLPATVG